jgi:hypothetical protein
MHDDPHHRRFRQHHVRPGLAHDGWVFPDLLDGERFSYHFTDNRAGARMDERGYYSSTSRGRCPGAGGFP